MDSEQLLAKLGAIYDQDPAIMTSVLCTLILNVVATEFDGMTRDQFMKNMIDAGGFKVQAFAEEAWVGLKGPQAAVRVPRAEVTMERGTLVPGAMAGLDGFEKFTI